MITTTITLRSGTASTDKLIRGDVGVLIKVDLEETMVGATGLSFEIEKPKTGTIVKWTPSINGDFLQYTTIAGDLDEVGVYKLSPILTQGTFDGRGPSVRFTVIDKYEV